MQLIWASYQIRKLRVAHALGMPGKFSPPPTSKETARYRCRCASRHCVTHVPRCWYRWPAVGGENVPGIPGACINHNFTYIIRGPWCIPLKPAALVFNVSVFWWLCLNMQGMIYLPKISNVSNREDIHCSIQNIELCVYTHHMRSWLFR